MSEILKLTKDGELYVELPIPTAPAEDRFYIASMA